MSDDPQSNVSSAFARAPEIEAEGPRVAVVIVNYRQPRLTEQAIRTVLASSGVRASAWVIENAGDGEWLEARYHAEPRVRWNANVGNIGFGAACNQGIERALAEGAEFIMLLNNDALLEPEALALLAPAAAAHGMAAPWIGRLDERLYSAGGVVELARGRARNRGYGRPDESQFLRPALLRFASACALMLSARALAGGVRFYEPYFLYYEDADFCLALGREGWRVAYEPRARVLHLESASTPAEMKDHTVYYSTRNRLLLLRRHAGPLTRAAGTAWIAAATLVRLPLLWLRGRRAHARALTQAWADALRGRFGARR